MDIFFHSFYISLLVANVVVYIALKRQLHLTGEYIIARFSYSDLGVITQQ